MWFTENPWPGVVIFLVLGGWFLVRALQTGLAKHWALAGVCAVAAIGVYVVEDWIVTPAEEIEARVGELLQACKAGEVLPVISFISDSNRNLQVMVGTGMALAKIHDDVRLTDMHVRMVANNTRGISHFRANGTISVNQQAISTHVSTRWEVTWQKEADEWKIVSIKRLNPLNGEEMQMLERKQS